MKKLHKHKTLLVLENRFEWVLTCLIEYCVELDSGYYLNKEDLRGQEEISVFLDT